MINLLDQLYKTKLQLIAVIATVFGVALLGAARWLARQPTPDWLGLVPLSELGSIVVGSGLLGILFEYLNRTHGEERANQRVRDVILRSLAFEPEVLKSVASTEMLERIATNALGLRLGDQALANEVYADLRNQIIRAPERWHDVDISVSLAPWAGGPATGTGSMFEATLRCEYRVRPATATMRFACVSDPDEYRELLRDPTVTAPWYVDQSGGVDAGSRQTFELLKLSVNGKPRKIRRTERTGAQLYSATLGREALSGGDEVIVAYTYRILIQRNGHVLYLDLPRPTKGLHVQLNYAGTGIRRVHVLDFIASSQRTRLDQTPESAPAKTIDISFDGWIFPGSGVAFVWVLKEEIDRLG